MSRGVPLNQLRCPTCEARWRGSDARTIDVFSVATEDLMYAIGVRYVQEEHRPYIVCKNGHMWTIKTLYRSEGALGGWAVPEEILLGELIGIDL